MSRRRRSRASWSSKTKTSRRAMARSGARCRPMCTRRSAASAPITNGSVRDIPAVAPGFQMLAGSLAPSHAYVHVVEFGIPVTVHGMAVNSGDLIHADRHGAVVVPIDKIDAMPAALDGLAKQEARIIGAARAPARPSRRSRRHSEVRALPPLSRGTSDTLMHSDASAVDSPLPARARIAGGVRTSTMQPAAAVAAARRSRPPSSATARCRGRRRPRPPV